MILFKNYSKQWNKRYNAKPNKNELIFVSCIFFLNIHILFIRLKTIDAFSN